jgi:hypothetical protein
VVWDVTPCSSFKLTDASEKYVASIFKIEEQAKHETSTKQAGYIPLRERNRYDFNKKREIVILGNGKLQPDKIRITSA